MVLGRSSKVWAALSENPLISNRIRHAISHKELASFDFTPNDRVWVLSYSRKPHENEAIFQRLKSAGVAEVVYVSSSSTIVAEKIQCYDYPKVKRAAEQSALTLVQARVLTIGLMYSDPQELPSGSNIATAYSDLAEFIALPEWPEAEGRRKYLFQVVPRPFRSATERALFQVYAELIGLFQKNPCLLRPIDLILRMLGMRWYGYVFLSNKLWISTMS